MLSVNDTEINSPWKAERVVGDEAANMVAVVGSRLVADDTKYDHWLTGTAVDRWRFVWFYLIDRSYPLSRIFFVYHTSIFHLA